MFNKNLKYYRLKNNMSMKELASLAGVSPMAISHYESGERKPGMETIKALAQALGVKVTDFLSSRNENLVFVHGEFRKGSKLSGKQQEYIREAVEEYMNRFYSAVDVLGGEILPEPPVCHGLSLSGDPEQDALAMRKYLHISESGPVGNLTELLENKGILIYVCDIENDAFSGMNGRVNERPYIVVNGQMGSERIRSTIVHEMAHFLFEWPENIFFYPGETEKEIADRVCTGELISCGTPCQFGDQVDWFANPTYNQYAEWTWQLSRHNEWKILALVYRKTGDERYAKACADQRGERAGRRHFRAPEFFSVVVAARCAGFFP